MSDIEVKLGLNVAGFESELADLARQAKQQLDELRAAGQTPSLQQVQAVGASFGELRGAVQARYAPNSPERAALEPAIRYQQSKYERELGQTVSPADFPDVQSNFREAGAAAAKEAKSRVTAALAADQSANSLREEAAQVVASRKARAELDQAVRALTLSQGNLTRTQEAQVKSGFLFGRQNLEGLPPTLGQIAGQSIATIARFAGAGALFYGITKSITDTVKQAQQLEYDFNILDSQLTGLGQQSQLPALKNQLFDIARNTGLATDEVAQLGVAFVGALGDSGAGGAATEIAAKIAVVAQLKPGEIFNDLVAGMKAFAATPAPKDQLAALQQIGDLSIQLRNATGVAPKEIVDFLGRVGPIARTTGLDLKSAAAAAATLLQGSAVGGAALGEEFGRILTGFSKSSADIAELAQQFPQLGISLQQALSGDPNVLFKLAEGFKTLSSAQQQQLIQQVGSRREGQTLAILFQNSTTLANAQAAAETAQGRADAELAKRKQTLQLQVQQLSVAFQQFGLALYNAGVGDALKDIVQIVSAFTHVLNDLSSVLDHVPHQLIQMAASLGLVAIALKGINVFSGGQGIISAIGASGFLGGRISGVLARRGTQAAAGEAGGLAAGSAAAARAAIAGEVAVPAAEAAGAVGLEAITGALGGPVGIGLVTAAILGPTILNALKSSNGALKKMKDKVNELRQADSDLGTGIKDELQKLIDDAGGDESKVSSQDLQGLIDRYTRKGFPATDAQKKEASDAKKLLAQRVSDRRAALIAYLRDQGVIDDQGVDEIAALFSSSRGGESTRRDLEAYLSGQKRKGFDPQSIGLTPDVLNVKKFGDLDPQKVAAAIQKALNPPDQPVTGAQAAQQQLSDVLATYDEGDTPLAVLDQAFQAEYDALRLATQPADIAQLAKDTKAVNKRKDDAARANYELQQSITSLSGASPTQVLQSQISGLNDLFSKTVGPSERIKVAQDLVKAEQQLLQQEASEATSAGQAAAILRNGIPIDKPIQAALIEAQLRATGSTFQAFLGQYVAAGLQITDSMYAQIANYVADGKSVAQALKILIDADIDQLKQAAGLAALFSSNVDWAELDKEVANLQGLSDALGKAHDPNFGIKDPTKVTGDATEKAKQDAQEIIDARKKYAEALVADDPVEAAKLAQREADDAYRRATSDAQRISAMADRIKADRQLQDALQAVAQSQIDLVIAQADAAGNTLEVAYVSELKARQALAYLQQNKPGDTAAINQAQIAVVSAHRRTIDADLQQREDQADFQHQMGQITDAQYVALLQTMLALPELTDKEKQDIQLKIHDLKKSLSGDLQFNLPTELGLPTLYEGRRLDQTGGAYVDNRNVVVNLYAAAGVDTQAIASEVVSQFNAAPRTGISPRLY